MTIYPKCFDCKWFGENGLWCKAYPKGIPMDILLNKKEHNEVLPDQEGDYIFVDKNKQEKNK